jgi:LysM repeat protein
MGIIMSHHRFCVFILFLCFGFIVKAQNYIIYDVKPNDTPQTIARDNNISLELLYQFNPDLRNIQSLTAQKIVIPKSENKNFGFIRYRVKVKETLYSISRNYNVSIADLKAFNPQLYENELKAGEVIKIPAYKLPEEFQNVDFNESIKNSNFTAFKHIVLPNERKSDIAEKYGISTQTFDSLNQDIIEVQSGQFVKIVPPKFKDEEFDLSSLDMNLQFYRVPRQKTLYSLSKEFKISEDIILKLNPLVRREGLKAGAIIKLPEQIESLTESMKIVNLENRIQNFNEKKLALFLPFNLSTFKKDSIDKKGVILKDNLLNISLDVYEGVTLAVDKARSKGIYTDLKVFDTKRNPRVLDSILSENNIADRDAVIGPLLTQNIQRLVSEVSAQQTPVFLPITKIENPAPHVFNTLPSEALKTETLITHIDSTLTENVNLIIITDSTVTDARQKYKYSFPGAKFLNVKGSFVEQHELKKLQEKDKANWVVLETNQIGVSESVVTSLYKFQKGYTKYEENEKGEQKKNTKNDVIQFNVRLFTSDRNRAFGEVLNNTSLSELAFTYVSVSKYDVLETNAFINDYVDANGFMPNRYVLRAYDLTYDILLRLAYEGTLNSQEALNPMTEYNENRFAYVKEFMKETYENKGLYIIRYKPDYEVDIINENTN